MEKINTLSNDSAYICGQIAHTTRSLLQSNTQSEVLHHCKSFFSHLNLSGFFKITTHKNKDNCFFGAGLKKKHLLQLQTFMVCSHKINNNGQLLSIKMPSVNVLLDIESFSDAYKDVLLDNIAIFVDSVQAWCDNFNEKFTLLHSIHQEKSQQVVQLKQAYETIKKNGSNLTESHNLMRQNLMCELVASFPTMALEQDQEEKILSHVEHCCEEHKETLQSQLDANQRMCFMLDNTMDMLLNCELLEQLESKPVVDFDNDADVELF